MRRALPWGLFGLTFMALLFLAWEQLSARFEIADRTGVIRFLSASTAFHYDLAQRACLDKAELVAAAADRGWDVQNPAQAPYLPLGATAPAGGAVRVFVDPPLPLSKDPGQVYWFDAEGCLANVD
ncbi:MAG: hypothetical protein AAF666_16130 [Pseudomonadota bacterium]